MRASEQWWEKSTLQARSLLAWLSPLCSPPLRLTPEVGEVVYSQAENKTNISTVTMHYTK